MPYDYLRQIGYDPFGVTESEDPALESLQQGEKPQPTYDYLRQIGYAIPDPIPKPTGPEPDVVLFEKGTLGEQLGRAGEILEQGAKQVGTDLTHGVLATSQYLNRLKAKIPGYNESEAMRSLIDVATRYGPGALAGTPDQESALQYLAESEYLKRDPEKAQTHNFFEDFLMVGPQIGSMILSNIAVPYSGVAMMGLQILGSSYQNLIEQGVDPDRAYHYALANGIVQGAIENVPFMYALNRIPFTKNLRGKVVTLGKTMGAEFLTEWMQSYPDSFTNIWATNPDKTLAERAEMFADQFIEMNKQGAYEGLLTAPWALLTFGGAGLANRVHKRIKDKKPAEPSGRPDGLMDESEVPPEVMADIQREPDQWIIPEYMPGQEGGMRTGPARQSSTVTDRHLEMMSPEQQDAYYNYNFQQQWNERTQRLSQIAQDRDLRKQRAQQAADAYAASKAAHAYWADDIEDPGFDPYSVITDRDKAARERIQKGLDLIPQQDIFDGEKLAISQREYDRRERLVGDLQDLYFVDKNLVPPDLRGAIVSMTEQVGTAEPRSSASYDQGELAAVAAEGEVVVSPSSYPDWFKAPFKIRYLKDVTETDKAGKPVMMPMLDAAGRQVLYKRGPKKGQPKMEKKIGLDWKIEDFKFGLSRDDYFNILGKVENGEMLTPRQDAIFNHILGIAQAVKSADPELGMQEDLAELEREGYEILGTSVPASRFDLTDQVVIEQPNGTWDQYTVISEDDGAGNMVLDSLSDRIQAAPDDMLDVVGHKKNGFYETLFELGGADAVAAAPSTLPGVKDIEPIYNLEEELSMAQLEEGFGDTLPEDATSFEVPELISRGPDRRQRDQNVAVDRRKGERRKNWELRDKIDTFTDEDKVHVIEKLREMFMFDLVTGVGSANYHIVHMEEIGDDNPYLFLDLDGFKWINDFTKSGILPDGRKVEGGHPLGDQVLGLFGKAMRDAVEITGVGDRVIPFRKGGDEFAYAIKSPETMLTTEELEKLNDALEEITGQIIVDLLAKTDDNKPRIGRLEGLPYTPGIAESANEAIAIAEEAKEDKPAEYAAGTKINPRTGKVQQTRAKKPSTLVVEPDKTIRKTGKGEGVLAREPSPAGEVGRGAERTRQAKGTKALERRVEEKPRYVIPPMGSRQTAIEFTYFQAYEARQIYPDVPFKKLVALYVYRKPAGPNKEMVDIRFASRDDVEKRSEEVLKEFGDDYFLGSNYDLTPYRPRKGEISYREYAAQRDAGAVRVNVKPPKPLKVEPVGVSAPIALAQPKAPRKKPEASQFVSENISILEGNELARVNVSYLDPETGEITQVPENTMEAMRDIEENVDLYFKLRECINA